MASVIKFWEKKQCPPSAKRSLPELDYSYLYKRLVCETKDVYTTDVNHVSQAPFVCKFRRDSANNSHILAIAMEEGDIFFLNAKSKSANKILKKWTAHNNAVFDLCWSPDGPSLVTGSGDNSVALWDANTCECTQTFCDHFGSVKCVDICPRQSALIASGARDGKINIWDSRVDHASVCINPEISISDAHGPSNEDCMKSKKRCQPRNPSRVVTTLAFQDEYTLVSAGIGDQTVKVWDLRKTYITKPQAISSSRKMYKAPMPKHSMFYGGDGCISMTFDSTYKNLYACCTNSVIYRYDCHSFKTAAVSTFDGFYAATYFVKMAISPDDQYLISGNTNEEACIWKISEPGKPIYSLTGHTAEVTAVTWHPYDVTKLVTCGDDSRTLIWRVNGEYNIAEKDEIFGSSKPVDRETNSKAKQTQDSKNNELAWSTTPRRNSIKNTSISNFFPKSSPSTALSSPCNTTASSPDVSSPPCKKQKNSDPDDQCRSVLTPKKEVNGKNASDVFSVEDSPRAMTGSHVLSSERNEKDSSSQTSKTSPTVESFSSPQNDKSYNRSPYCRTPHRSKRTPKHKNKKSQLSITSYFKGTP